MVVMLTVVGLTQSCGGSIDQSSSEAIAKSYTEALNRGDVATAFKCVYTEGADIDAIKKKLEKSSIFHQKNFERNVVRTEVGRRDKDGQVGVAVYCVDKENARETLTGVSTINKSGKWYVVINVF